MTDIPSQVEETKNVFIRGNDGVLWRVDRITRAEPQGDNYRCETDDGTCFTVSAGEFEEARDMVVIVAAAPPASSQFEKPRSIA